MVYMAYQLPATTAPPPTTAAPATIAAPLTTAAPPTTAAPAPTAAPATAPSECLTATNLLEYWRKDHTGEGDYTNCDTRDMQSSGRPWFRFSGAAGNQLLNTCPPPYSCGTVAGMWSDETMPSSVGQSIDITVYGSISFGSHGSGCKQYPKPASVMRCSLRHGDFIYRHNGDILCKMGFCGMD